MEREEVTFESVDGVRIAGVLDIPQRPMKRCIVLCHGITADKDENGKFVSLSNSLCVSGFEVMRFDFRGHGESGLKSEEVTISGELMDIEATISYLTKERKYNEIGLLAASFGAGPAILFTINHETIVKTLVLWNPVLDYEQTFLKPKLPWGNSIFSSSGLEELRRKGFVTIPGKGFRIGRKLVAEFEKCKPYKELAKVRCPVLTIHGTNDKKAPYWIAEQYGKPNELSEFMPIESDHGFGDKKDYVILATVNWFEKFLNNRQ